MRKFEIVESYERVLDPSKKIDTPFIIDELKPGYNTFESVWTRDCQLETYQVVKVRAGGNQQDVTLMTEVTSETGTGNESKYAILRK